MNQQVKLQLGSRIHFDGDTWRVAALTAGSAFLISHRGQSALVELAALVGARDFEVLEPQCGTTSTPIATFPDSVPKKALEAAEKLLAHLNEVQCGYKSGDATIAAPDEPKINYDPSCSNLTQRMAAKSIETGISVRTLWELTKSYKKSGIYGLVDKRIVRTAKKNYDPRVINAIQYVQASLTQKTNITKSSFKKRVEKYLATTYPDESIPLGSKTTFYRLLDRTTKGSALFDSAKRRRSIANQPQPFYRKFYVNRPGETVLIDSTPFDAFALDPVSFSWVKLQLTLALDLYTASILAWRFTPISTKGVDAALLLYDIIRPKLMQPGWPSTARWPYVGVPESIVIELRPESSVCGVAGIPVVNPETVVIDHGKVFISQAFRDACARLGINIQLARPFTPTDKGHVERVFRTIREQFIEELPGYKGPDLYSRGLNVEKDAFYFIDEIDSGFAEWVVTYYQCRHHEGLALPNIPHLNISPNDMYNEGLVRAGFVHVVTSETMYYEMLPTAWRTVQHYGIEFNGLRYDGDELDNFRNQRSEYGGINAGKWPVRYDPRDLSRLFFYDPDSDRWHTLYWAHSTLEGRPFNEATLAYAKALVIQRGGNRNNVEDLADTLNGVLDRMETASLKQRVERRRTVINAMNAEQARKDRPKQHGKYMPPDAEVNLIDEMPIHSVEISSQRTDSTTSEALDDEAPLQTIDEAMENDRDNLLF